MNKSQILHQAAMDFYDIGRVARAKGKPEIFDEYLPISPLSSPKKNTRNNIVVKYFTFGLTFR